MVKIELPGSVVGNATWPPITTMFNWRAHLDRASATLWGDKKPEVDDFWRRQIAQWTAYNATPQGIANPAGPPPDIIEGNCRFEFTASGPNQATRVFQTEDTLWIKHYNGSTPGYYMFWDTGTNQWGTSPTNNLGFNYVNRICANVQ